MAARRSPLVYSTFIVDEECVKGYEDLKKTGYYAAPQGRQRAGAGRA